MFRYLKYITTTVIIILFASVNIQAQTTVEQKLSNYLICVASNSNKCIELTPEEQKKLQANFCAKSSSEALLDKELFEASWYGTTLLLLLSGNIEKATNQLGSELSTKILYLNEILEKNPCGISEKKLKRIFPFFRLISAINKNHPIAEINDNTEIMTILSRAVKQDKEHYTRLLNIYK